MTDGADDVIQQKSRSQLKRQAKAITALGAALAEVSPKALERIPLPPEVAAAVTELRAIKSHGARKRQLAYLGKLLRGEDLAPIQEALDRVLDRNKAGTLEARRHEIWCDRIIREGDAGIDACLADYPLADRQRLRQLQRAASRAKAESSGEAARRTLLRYLREVAPD